MAARKLSPEQIEAAVEMRERGVSVGVIARRLGVSYGCVSWHCLKEAAEPPHGTRSWDAPRGPLVAARNGHTVRRFTPAEDAKLLQLEADGLSDAAIGRELSRRPNSIRGRLMTLARRDAQEDRA